MATWSNGEGTRATTPRGMRVRVPPSPLISDESLINMMYDHRTDKLAVVLLVGFMGGDSTLEAWTRLDDFMPTIRDLARRSAKGYRGKDKLKIDSQIALRVRDLAEQVEPWLRQIAEADSE